MVRRRYEILLPLQFNDGQSVPETLLWETVEQLETHFHALSWETQVIRGIWHHEGTPFRDNHPNWFSIWKIRPKTVRSLLRSRRSLRDVSNN